MNNKKLKPGVFAVVKEAKTAIEKYGKDNVVNATIGSLYDEDGNFVTYDEVLDLLRETDNVNLSKYADGVIGNEDYLESVYKWLFNDISINLHTVVRASSGGTGALSNSLKVINEVSSKVCIPDIGWGPYKTIVDTNNLDYITYKLFDDNGDFNINSIIETVKSLFEVQDNVSFILNTPGNNPTGYSCSLNEMSELIEKLNNLLVGNEQKNIYLINDVAYIDYVDNSREYMNVFDEVSSNLHIVVAFSLSKTLALYGQRVGATIFLSKNKSLVSTFGNSFEYYSRGTWSNVNNAVMNVFSKSMSDESIKQSIIRKLEDYRKILKLRTDLFKKECDDVNLKYYKFNNSFFVTLKYDIDFKDKMFKELKVNNIFTVNVFGGIRIGLCSLNISKIKGLAYKIKKIEESL